MGLDEACDEELTTGVLHLQRQCDDCRAPHGQSIDVGQILDAHTITAEHDRVDGMGKVEKIARVETGSVGGDSDKVTGFD